MKELSCPLILLVICLVGLLLTLPGCATMPEVKVRIPLGANEEYGALEFGGEYIFPRDFHQKLADWLPVSPFRPAPDSATIKDK